MKTFYTYLHCKPDGSIFYVGKGMGDRATSKENRNRYWKRTVNKYGYEVKIIAYWETENEAFEHEKQLISEYKALGIKLVNLTNGGEGSAGYRWTDEQKANFDMCGSNNGMFGKKHSDETKRKLSEKAKARKLSDETKAKLSKAMKNRVFSESHLEKLKISGLGNKNGLGNKGNAKKCKINGIIYESTKQAAKIFGLAPSSIQRRCLNPKHLNYEYI